MKIVTCRQRRLVGLVSGVALCMFAAATAVAQDIEAIFERAIAQWRHGADSSSVTELQEFAYNWNSMLTSIPEDSAKQFAINRFASKNLEPLDISRRLRELVSNKDAITYLNERGAQASREQWFNWFHRYAQQTRSPIASLSRETVLEKWVVSKVASSTEACPWPFCPPPPPSPPQP